MPRPAPWRSLAGSAVLALGLLASALPAGPAAAAAAEEPPLAAMTLVGEEGDRSPGPRSWTSRTALVRVTGDGGSVHAEASEGAGGPRASVSFVPPAGQLLAVGDYRGTSGGGGERGRLVVTVDGNECLEQTGRFRVLDVAHEGGALTRLHALYERTCGDDAPYAAFGEIRLGVPEGAAEVEAQPAAVQWPDAVPGRRGTDVPVVLRNRASTPVSRGPLALTGADPGAFQVVHDRCPSVLPAGGACTVTVRFLPERGGAAAAVLATGVPGLALALHGDGVAASTSMRLSSEPGDPIGRGFDVSYRPLDADLKAGLVRDHTSAVLGVSMTAWNPQDGHTTLEFLVPAGEVLEAGRTYGPPQVVSYGLTCSRRSGSFTVHEHEVRDGVLVRFAASFTHTCADSTAGMRGAAAFRAAVEPRLPGTVLTSRAAGADRYGTAAAVSGEVRRADEVLLVSGVDWPDALAAGPAAAHVGGTVLPSRPDGVPADTLVELYRLQARTVHLIGGTAALGPAVEAELVSRGFEVDRVSGPDRYATAAAVAARFFPLPQGAYYASGTGFADALAGATAAGVRDRPLLLVRPDGVPAGTPLPAGDRVVLGGTAAVGEQVRAALGARRLMGADRYATSVAVAEDLGASAPYAVLASGQGFPDALAAAPVAALRGAPLLLAARDCVTPAVAGAARRLGVAELLVVGGTVAVSDGAARLSPC